MKLQTLIEIYHAFNAEIFGNVLHSPAFFATRARGEYASYEAGLHGGLSVIWFNSREIKGHWARSIVFHEMIHQYLEEFLQVEESDHHGPKFWKEYRKFAPHNIVLFEGL